MGCQKQFQIEVATGDCNFAGAISTQIPAVDSQRPIFTEYASNAGRVFGGGDTTKLDVLSASTNSFITSIEFSAQDFPLVAILNPDDGMLYVACDTNIPNGMTIYQVNPNTLAFVSVAFIANAHTPTQMAYDPTNNRIYWYTNFSATLARSELFSMQLPGFAVSQVALTTVNGYGCAYADDLGWIFCEVNAGSIGLFRASDLVQVSSFASGVPFNMAYCPTNSSLYVNIGSGLNVQVFTVQPINQTVVAPFNAPAIGANIVIFVSDTAGMIIGENVSINGTDWEIVADLGAPFAEIKNLSVAPGTPIGAGSSFNYSGWTVDTNIALPADGRGIAYSEEFDRIFVCSLQNVYCINPATNTIVTTVNGAGTNLRCQSLGTPPCKVFMADFGFGGGDPRRYQVLT